MMDFRKLIDIVEGGVGVVARNSKEASDPRYSMSVTQDVKPGETKRQAAKFGNTVDANGMPPLLHKSAAKNSSPNKLMNLGLNEEEKPANVGRKLRATTQVSEAKPKGERVLRERRKSKP